MSTILGIDIETYSSVPLPKCGVYRYTDAPDFEILLFSYLSEDMDWCGDLLLYSNRFDFYENPLYVYRQQRSGSITAVKC